MKILMLNYEFPPLGGGASPVSYEIAKQLSEQGFNIDVVTMGYKSLPDYEEINKNSRIHRVKCWRNKKEICHPWEQLTYLISGYFKCKKLLRENKYDICHCHFIIPTGVLALKLKKKFGLKYIITSHGSDVLGYNPRFKKLYPFLVRQWEKILNGAEKIITPSNFLKREILKVYPDFNESKIEVIPNGIEKNKFFPMKKEKYILLVSRLFINKGIQDFIEAIKDLDLGNWQVKIVGEGPYRKNLEGLTKRYNLENKIQFLSWVNNKSKKMKELYGKASIFVLPSHFENMNITLLEAMQAKCAVLVSDVGGNREVVGEVGILFSESDTGKLREEIKKLIKNEPKIKLLSQQAGQRIEEKFGWEKIEEKYSNLLHKYAKK